MAERSKIDSPPRNDPFRRVAANGLRHARRLIIAVTGTTVLLLGAVMLLTPGPGLLGIGLGLMILGVEFAWARRLLVRVKRKLKSLRKPPEASKGERPGTDPISGR